MVDGVRYPDKSCEKKKTHYFEGGDGAFMKGRGEKFWNSLNKNIFCVQY